MANIHMVLTGKGGAGKSTNMAFLAQFLTQRNGVQPVCIDTDPVNESLNSFKGIKCHEIRIGDKTHIRKDAFDEVLDVAGKADTDVVIDTGATTFVPLSSYILSLNIAELLQEEYKKNLIIHSILQGAGGQLQTFNHFDHVARQFPKATPLVVWINTFLGPVLVEGKPFEKTELYVSNKQKIAGLIHLPELDSELENKHMLTILNRYLLFNEAIANADEFTVFQRQRIKKIRDDIYAQIAAVKII